jgi:hypothetical protein
MPQILMITLDHEDPAVILSIALGTSEAIDPSTPE